MSGWKRCAALAVGSLLIGFGVPSAVKADFVLVSQNMSFDQQNQTSDFNLTFNQQPNFSTLNSLGIPENSFQVEFAANYSVGGPQFPLNLTSVVRGDEIHLANALRVRAATGAGGPTGGGWGPVVDTVPYSLVGDTVSFSVPTKDLGWTKNAYQYNAFALQYGKETSQQVVTMVPTPSALKGGIPGLLIVAGVTVYMRRKSRVGAI